MSTHAQTDWDPWTYRTGTGTEADLVGFHVHAADGGIGTVEAATYEVGSSYVVVDTGSWILGHRLVLPAGTLDRVDGGARCVHVARTKEEIRKAPRPDDGSGADREHRDRLGEYYRRFGY